MCILLLAGACACIIVSWKHLRGSDDAELAGWCVAMGLGLSAAAAFLAERVFFTPQQKEFAKLRFVVLRHEGIDDPHFDLMLETSPGSALATWRTPCWPIIEQTMLEQLADHRNAYLEYEGKISGDRGTVRRIDSGIYQITDAGDNGKVIQWIGSNIPPTTLLKREGIAWIARCG